MRRRLHASVMLGLLLMGCNRRHDVDVAQAARHLPAADLDTWLAQREAHQSDIVSGSEAMIRRVSPGRTPLAFVFLHGFSASRQELSPLVETLSDRFGANSYFARLRGHGRTGDAMLDGSVQSWMEDTAEAMEIGRRLGERVVVVGSSTGGTLTAWLASQNPPDLAAVVYLSPNFALHDKRSRMMSWPGRRLLLRLVVGTHREWTPSSEAVARAWTHRYPAPALLPMIDLVHHVADVDLSTSTQPAMVVYSPNDQIIDPSAVEDRFAQMGAEPKQLLAVTDDTDDDHHVIVGDLVSPNTTAPVADAIGDFLDGALMETASSAP